MRTWDGLNSIVNEYEPIDIREYFSVMDIPEKDIEKRVEMAEDIDDIYIELFNMIALSSMVGEAYNQYYYMDYIERRLRDVVNPYGYDYLNRYAVQSSEDTVNKTFAHEGDNYYLSDERASRLAVENAQTICNYTELEEAIEAGYTHKTWVAEIDRHTRDEHREMNGETIPIEEYFQFSDCEMLMPHDEINGTGRQCANCRCSLSYKTMTKSDEDGMPFDGRIKESINKPQEIIANKKDGVFAKETNFRNSDGEEKIGIWLYETFGGDLTLLAENNPEGKRNPDFLWNGRLWELKTPRGTKNITKLIQKGLLQIEPNPGGIIIDVSNISAELAELEKIIDNRLRLSAKFDTEIIVHENGKLIKIIEYKK